VQDIFLVSLGGVIGVSTRFIIYKKLEKINLRKDFLILIINTLASFFLGLFSSFILRISSFTFSHQLVLFFSIGFLGSLSTFSTFVYDLFDLFSQFKFFSALKLLIFSLALGLIALAFGLFVGNQ
tara:strand:+ start:256 stop:630 length:375 start_codon:yes stop_codon:yes gene_type:complete